jgi:metal transporter CNNM
MAIVVPKPFNSLQANIQTSPKGSFNEFQAPRWTATEKMNAHILSRLKGLGLDGSTDWPTDFMGAAKSNIENPICPKKDVVGIRCPKPVGIVTFEDVIDAILQKTSRDERDFFDRENIPPPTKSKKTGDYINPQHDNGQKEDGVPVYARKAQVSFQRSLPRTLRRRNVSTKVLPATGAMDGADELSIDSAGALAIILRRSRSSYEDSSYTGNSQGGFHCSDESRSTVISLPKAEELASSSPCIVLDSPVRTSVKTPIRTPLKTPIKTPIKASARTVSLPSKRAVAIALPERLTPGLRQVSSGVRLPRIRRVTPFSRQHYSSYERMEQTEKQESISSVAPMSPAAVPARQSDPSTDINHPKVDTDSSVEPSRSLDNAGKSSGESSGVALSLVSWCPNGLVDVDKWNEGIYDSSAVDSSATLMVENHAPTPECEVQQDTDNIAPEPYGGFPPELLDVSNTGKENRTSKAVASTLPRMIGLRADVDSLVDRHDCVGPVREESFHDDRAMLPSQRRVINTSASMNMSGPRSSSLWF